MAKSLIIAEKKSLAEAIAKAIGNYKNCGDYFIAKDGNEEYYITYTFGHILQANIPKTLEKAGYPNAFPIFPNYLVLEPKKERRKLFATVKKLIQDNSFKKIISAGDPDREGELLVREVLNYCKVDKKKVYRMWFNSLTEKELKRAVREAKPITEFDHLYKAGLSRQIADFWLGINGTTALSKKTGKRNISIGRVQTPILKLIYDREMEIENFKPQDYYVLKIEVEKDSKPFWAVYVKPNQRKKDEKEKTDKTAVNETDEDSDTEEEEKKIGLSKEQAEKLLAKVKKEKKATVLSVEKKRKKQKPPKLPCLSDLQVEAGKYKMGAKQVLSIVQSLYEKKIVSYPRTSSNYLSTNDKTLVMESLEKLGYSEFKNKIPSWIFNDKDVEEAGHHAIIPLDKYTGNDERERLIYNLILKRFLAQFYPLHEYDETTVILECAGEKFKAVGKVVVVEGWKELYKGEPKEKGKKEEPESRLPSLAKGEKIDKKKEKLEKKTTKPPARYTSATLIRKMKKLGLGTEATRANYEELLKKRGYIKSEKGKIYITNWGKAVLEAGIKDLTFADAEFTSMWEKYLEKMARKKFKNITEAVNHFLEKTKKLTVKTVEEINRMTIERKEEVSPKMLAFALSIAEKTGTEFDESKKSDYQYVKDFITKNKEKYEQLRKQEKPSEKQLTLIRKIAEDKGIDIPKEVFESKIEATRWLNENIGLGRKKGSRKKKKKKKKK